MGGLAGCAGSRYPAAVRSTVWLWGVLAATLACELSTREVSPASLPARVMTAPVVQGIDPAVLAAAVRDGVRRPDANQGMYEVDAFLVALAVEDLASGRPSLLVQPSPAGGPIGFVISGVREGSLYAALDLRDGDVIEAINGAPLDAPERGLEALAGSQRGARLQIVRAGVGMTRELRVVEGLAWGQVLAQRTGAAPPASPGVIEAPVIEDMPVADAGSAQGVRRPGSPGSSVGTASTTPRGTPSNASSSAPASSSSLQCGSDGACSVTRREFDAIVADPDKLSRQVQVSPSGSGYRLSGIRGGSQVSQLGFQNGDVITAVNGTRLDDQLGLLGLYAGLDSTRSYNVTFTRGGARRTKTLRLRD